MSKWRAIGPISNFNLLCDELQFPNFVIRRFEEEELLKLMDTGRDHWADFEFNTCKHYPWFLMEYDAPPGREWYTAINELEYFLDALFLLNNTFTILRVGQFYVRKLEGEGLSGHFGGTFIRPLLPVVVLKKEKCIDIIQVYNKYRNFLKESENEQKKRILFALNFFRRVRQTRDYIARFIFLSVSLEALFSGISARARAVITCANY